MERRDFLAGGLAAVAARIAPAALADDDGTAGVRAGTAAADASAGAAGAAAVLDRATFASLLQSDFLFYPGGRGVKLRLVRVIDGTRSASPRLRQFSLVFASGAHVLKSGTYEVDVPGLPRQQMSIEHLGAQGGEVLYRADFALL